MLTLTLMAAGLSGCGAYADFTLPRLPRAAAATLTARLDAEPVLRRATESDILNPSVIHHGGLFLNFYSAFDGRTWSTALADSPDGVAWTKQGRVLSPDPRTWEGAYIAANGSAMFDRGEFWYWYQAGDNDLPRIGLARSPDGRRWRKEPLPVLEPGPRGSWDERGVADPYVLTRSGIFYLYYLGQNRARQQQLGLARSDDGLHWTKLRSNPVITIPWPGSGRADENGLGEPAVWESNGWYWMIYTGRDVQERRALLTARSGDGVHWIPQSVVRGNAAWDSQVVCDPTVLTENSAIRLWFGGGDKPRPDENLDGQIGAGRIDIEVHE